MFNNIIAQGSFTSDGTSKLLQLRQGVDWMFVRNRSIATSAQTTAVGCEYWWQVGYPDNAKTSYFKSNAANAANLIQYLTTGGFTYVDSTLNLVGPLNATITAVSNAAIPVVSNSGTNGLAAGDVVRIIDVTGAQQLGGIDFTVGYNTLTTGTFSLDYAPQIVAGTTGSWRKVNFNSMFYPRARVITKITQATQAVVTFSVTHGYQVGQKITFSIPSGYGMTELNGLTGTVVAVDTTTTTGNSVTVDINTSAFTAFAWPLTAAGPFGRALAAPAGENTAVALQNGLSSLDDAYVNTGYIGMLLAGGANNPGGANGNVIDWIAGTSFSVNNE